MADYFPTKYDSAADEIIAALSDEAEGYGTRDDTTGEVDAPTGYVSLVIIPADVDLTADYMGGDMIARLAADYGVTAADVAGVHIVTTNDQGFVSVVTFDTEDEARAAFDQLSAEYAEWLGDEEDD